jgi:hypothetical protein
MNQVIRDAYNNCKPEEWLKPEDPRYVPLNDLGVRGTGVDLVKQLRKTIDISDAHTRQLVSGFRGSGKTTELLRLAKALEDSGYWTIFVDTDEYLNLRVPATVSDLWMVIASKVDAYLAERDPKHQIARRLWSRIAAFFNREVEIEDLKLSAEVSAPGEVAKAGAEIQVALKENPDLRRRINEALENKRPALVKECRGFVEEAIAILRRLAPGKTGVVIIVDSFEKLAGDHRNGDEVRASAEMLFVRDWALLAMPCHVIYTVPPWLAFADSAPQLARTHMLPMCKVYERPKGSTIDRDACKLGTKAMMDLLAKRMNLKSIFAEGTKELERIVCASGGYPRDLLRLVQDVLFQHVEVESLPITPASLASAVDRAISELRQQYAPALSGEDFPLLKKINDSSSEIGLTKVERLRIAELFEHHFVLSYQNGERWLDLHPLLRDVPQLREYLAKPGKG